MKIKVYLNDWMINLGIVGFIKILKDSNVDKLLNIEDNYIEFDTNILKDFQNYYFNYFMDKNDVTKIVQSKCSKSIDRIKVNEKELVPQIKWLKEQLKKECDKVKKIDEEIYDQMKCQIDGLSDIKKIDEIAVLEKSLERFLELLDTPYVKEKITLNRFKNNLSTYFFGQVSFYNVVKNSMSYDEHLKNMYNDYLSDIVESGYINDYYNNKYTLEDLKKHIQDIKDELEEKEFKSVYPKYVKLNKLMEKENEEGKVKEYIKNEMLNYCTLCANEEFSTSDYTEGNFLPLAVSTENAVNFFYNQNAKMPICSICKLMLFCIPAGVNEISEITRDYEKGQIVYNEKTIYNFINFDTDVETLVRTNIDFQERIKVYGKDDGDFKSVILDIVHQKKKISEWELSNIFVVEFDAEYRGHSRIEYFNIQKYVADFFVKYSDKTVDKIKNRSMKLKIIDCILKNKNIIQVINDNTRNVVLKKKGYYNPYDSFLGIKTNMYINMLRKEGENMVDSENNKKLSVLYNIGTDLHEAIINKKEDNKLTEYSYKMLNSIKSGNKNEFMDIVIRLHMSYGKDISKIFLDVMKEEMLDFETIGHSFLSGFISKKYVKDDNQKNSEEIKEV